MLVLACSLPPAWRSSRVQWINTINHPVVFAAGGEVGLIKVLSKFCYPGRGICRRRRGGEGMCHTLDRCDSITLQRNASGSCCCPCGLDSVALLGECSL